MGQKVRIYLFDNCFIVLDFNYNYLLELLLLLAYPCQGNYTPDTVVNFKRPTGCLFYLTRHQLFRKKNYYCIKNHDQYNTDKNDT